ncbi:MAG: LacI family DNA-binding transcriptional regulator [Verrucomicrobiota bacterium]
MSEDILDPTKKEKRRNGTGVSKGHHASQSPRLIDIAKKVGVSVQAVSLVLRGAEGVGPAMREKIQKEVQRIGYRRNRFASKFFSKKTKTFGVVVPQLAESWIGLLAEELHHNAVTIGFDTEIFLTNHDPVQEEKVLDDLVGMRVDGIALVSRYWRMSDIPSTHYIKVMKEEAQRVPIVTSSLILGSGVPAVSHDLYQGVRDAVIHLAGRGHKNFALLAMTNESVERVSSYRYRIGGFRRGLRDAGLPDAGQIISAQMPKVVMSAQVTKGNQTPLWTISRPNTDYYKTTIRELVKRLFAATPRPTAVICANDIIAIHIIRAIEAEGLKVPDDFAVVGCDDTYLAEMAAVPLTTISLDLKSQAQQMIAELLSFQHPDYRPPRERRISPRLVVRESA